MNCGDCNHYLPRPDIHADLGNCKRYPPTPFQEPRMGLDAKPMLVVVAYSAPVHKTDNCGEWMPRPVAMNDPATN